MATCVLVVALLVPQASRAQGSNELQSYLVSVNRLYENLEYERALEQISSAKRLTRGMADDVLLSLYEGVILADMGKWNDATAAFKSALFLQPEAKLPVKVSPKVEKRFEAVRQQVKKELGPAWAKREAERQQAEAEAQRLEAERQKQAEAERQQAEAKAQQEAQARAALTPEATPRAGEVSGSTSLRSRALIPAIAGGVLLAAGGVSYGLARGEQSKLSNNDPSLATRADVDASISRGKTYQTVGFGLLGAGVVGLGVATGLFVLGSPQEPVSLGVSTDGTSAFVYGRWP